MLFNVLHTQSVQEAMVFENPHTLYTMEVSSKRCWPTVLIQYQMCSLLVDNIDPACPLVPVADVCEEEYQ